MKGILAAILSTIIGIVILGGLEWAVENQIEMRILLPWGVIYLVVILLLFGFIFKQEKVSKKEEKKEKEEEKEKENQGQNSL